MKIFLSYGHDENSELVERIKRDLDGLGHQSWIDKDQIKAGDNWRRTITDGIVNSEWVLSFLSRHACREWVQDGQRHQGVCLDELAIAIGTKGSVVKTILVESPDAPDPLAPPLTVSHIQYLDMHNWKAMQAQGEEVFEPWYKGKFAEIVALLSDEKNMRLAGEIESLRKELQPLDNSNRIGELMAHGFVGRAWLLEEIDHWLLHQPAQKVFCLTGEPGYGKSSIAAWLAYQNRPEIIAAHFCQYSQPNYSDPSQVIRSIAFQMASRLPDYRRFLIDKLALLRAASPANDVQQQLQALLQGPLGAQMDAQQLKAMLEQLAQPSALARLTPSELFQALIADTMHLTIEGGRKRHLIVIDALDESGAELAQFLALHQARFPAWIALFITSRPNEDGIRQHLSMLNAHYHGIADARNQADITAWLMQWLGSRGLQPQQLAATLPRLLEASEGNFHYLRTFRHMAEQDAGLLETPDVYPRGLDSLYLSLFQRQFADPAQYRQWQAPFLRLVAAARQPLPLELARKIAGLHAEQWHIQVLAPLGSLFNMTEDKAQAGQATGGLLVEPFHKSLRDWLAQPERAGRYFVAAADGHLALAQALWQDFAAGRKLQDYGLGELPYHLNQLDATQLGALVFPQLDWSTGRLQLQALAQSMVDGLRYVQAEDWLRLILRLDALHFGEQTLQAAGSLEKLAELLRIKGSYDPALALLQQALAIREALQGPGCADTGQTLNALAVLLHAKGDYPAAAPLYERALAVLEAQLAPHDARRLQALLTLANLREAMGDYAAAEQLQLQVLELRERAFGPDSLELAPSLANFGNLLHAMGLYEKAEPFCRRALAIREAACGADHPDTASSLDNVAALLHAMGQFEASEALQRRALEARKKTLGAEHPSTATSHNNLGNLLRAMGQPARAEPHCRQALAIWERRLGPLHTKTGTSLNTLGTQLQASQDLAGAEAAYRRALSIWEMQLGPHHPDTATCLDNLGAVLRLQGRLGEAWPLCLRAQSIRAKVLGPDHPDTAGSAESLGLLHQAEGDWPQALLHYQQALAVRQQCLGPQHPKTVRNQALLAEARQRAVQPAPPEQRPATLG